MPRRYFNWKLATVLLIGVLVLGIAAYTLRQFQVGRRADRGLLLGDRAYSEQKWAQAARYLGSYIAVVRDDVPVLLKYADAQLRTRPLRAGNIQQAVAVYRTVLRLDKRNIDATMRLTEIYLAMNKPGEAELIASRQLVNDQIEQIDPNLVTIEEQRPKLYRILAIALAKQRRFEQAVETLKTLVVQHPEYILGYETMGLLIKQRPDDFLGKPAEYWFDLAVSNNPSSALAYIVRGAFHLREVDRFKALRRLPQAEKSQLKALADLEQAEQLDLSDISVRLRLATELIKANLLSKAQSHLIAVRNTEPVNLDLWKSWAQLAIKSQFNSTMN
jgi:tetratricopeptide (TPR) repeat protein